jgi:hypothetical protein
MFQGLVDGGQPFRARPTSTGRAAIGQRLFVSRYTASSEISSIYRNWALTKRRHAHVMAIGLLGG